MKKLEIGTVLSNQQIREDIWIMWVEAPEICQDAQAGHFVHIKVSDTLKPVLRRPISIGRIDGDKLELIWRVVGEGTKILAEKKEGDSIDLLGPLGTTFDTETPVKHIILVAGGLGLPPIASLYNKFISKGRETNIFLGIKNRTQLPLRDDDELISHLTITAEDGGEFREGFVTVPVKELLEKIRRNGELSETALFACGPWGLIGALKKAVPMDELKYAQVSLEQNMACGIGVCQGCAVKAEGGKTPYRLVCSDGPVFDFSSIEVPGE